MTSREVQGGTDEIVMSGVRADERPIGSSSAERETAHREGASPRTKRRPQGEARLGELFDAHAPFLVRAVARMVGSKDQAEDVVQRAFLTAHRKGLPEGDDDRARAWLYRVAMNEVRHERRSLARRLRLASKVQAEPQTEQRGPDLDMESADQVARVRKLVLKLPEKQREVFSLYELEEMSGSDIAQLLSIPENTVWSRLRLARARFKTLWSEQEQEPRS